MTTMPVGLPLVVVLSRPRITLVSRLPVVAFAKPITTDFSLLFKSMSDPIKTPLTILIISFPAPIDIILSPERLDEEP